jgi:hypothetical protein
VERVDYVQLLTTGCANVAAWHTLVPAVGADICGLGVLMALQLVAPIETHAARVVSSQSCWKAPLPYLVGSCEGRSRGGAHEDLGRGTVRRHLDHEGADVLDDFR